MRQAYPARSLRERGVRVARRPVAELAGPDVTVFFVNMPGREIPGNFIRFLKA
jgi:hypothetical protein